MTRKRTTKLIANALAILAFLAWSAPLPACAQAILPPGFSDLLVAGGLSYSTSMDFLPDGRVIVTEKSAARVRLIVNDALVGAPVAVIDSVRQSPESGLLGVAVDPGWPARPYVYLHYNYLGSFSIRIARYTAVGDVAFVGDGFFTLDPSSRHLVLADLADLSINHNGGGLRFGADGMLYVSLGDDVFACTAVQKFRLQGKILRLDVSQLPAGPGGAPPRSQLAPPDNPFFLDPNPDARLVWAYGLRNPFSFQIDAPSGDLFIADPGDATWEEVDWANAPGMNFGWPSYEGPRFRNSTCPDQDTLTAIQPIYAYDRTAFLGGAAVITSPRYRRPESGAHRFPEAYDGNLFVSDVGEGFLRRLEFDGSAWSIAAPVPGQPNATDWAHNMDGVTDYALRPDGALWYLKYSEAFLATTAELRKIAYDNTISVPASPGLGTAAFEPAIPSPAIARTTLSFTLPRAGRAGLVIVDLSGRRIRRLVAEHLPSGRHTIEWDLRDGAGRRVPAGVYFAQIDYEAGTLEQRLVVLR